MPVDTMMISLSPGGRVGTKARSPGLSSLKRRWKKISNGAWG